MAAAMKNPFGRACIPVAARRAVARVVYPDRLRTWRAAKAISTSLAATSILVGRSEVHAADG